MLPASFGGALCDIEKIAARETRLFEEFVFSSFSVGFRTTPMDSTGVSHILEHTVLCGSQSYPVRDPFFKMLNRSLSTFMNAFTGMIAYTVTE